MTNYQKNIYNFSDRSCSYSLTGETDSQVSEISFSDVKNYNAHLAWHKLDFEIEFGLETSKVKDKFLNYEI